MLASKHFNIELTDQDDWFDPILDADTELFVDPFLIFKEGEGSWLPAHDKIIEHFNRAFLLIAENHTNPQALSYKKALHLLTFKEPKELCLGYTSLGTSGSGGGAMLARAVANSAVDAIGRGMSSPSHFEELGILNKGLGPDLISDITCTILKPMIIEYTQEIALRHGIPLTSQRLFASSFDEQRQRWVSAAVDLPVNPYTNSPLLFIPKRFLNRLPSIEAYSWWENYQNEQLREDLSYEILHEVDKEIIIETALTHRDAVNKWIAERESEPATSYDIEADPDGVYQWDPKTAEFALKNPLSIPAAQTEEEFFGVIQMIISQFKLFIEEQGGWWLLWDGVEDKREHAPQLVFRGIGANYCKANNISLDSEVNLGRGPVDFKFSNGHIFRAHLEVKKLQNGKFWNGLSEQLPSYMKSDEVKDGWFVVMKYRDTKTGRERLAKLPTILKTVSDEKQINLRSSVVDCSPKESASKL